MKRKIILTVAFLVGAALPSCVIWLAGIDFPTKRGPLLMTLVMFSPIFALGIASTTNDFFKDRK